MIYEGKKYQLELNGKNYHCPMSISMDLLNGKWKAIILYHLKGESIRFGKISELIPEMNDKTLSLQLKSLEETGLINRVDFKEVPLRVEYSLSDLGETLSPILESLANWGYMMCEKKGSIQLIDN